MADVDHLDHVRVGETGGGPRLGDEAGHEHRVLGELLLQDLQRHLPVQADLLRAVDRAHAALAQHLEQAEATQPWLGAVVLLGLLGRSEAQAGCAHVEGVALLQAPGLGLAAVEQEAALQFLDAEATLLERLDDQMTGGDAGAAQLQVAAGVAADHECLVVTEVAVGALEGAGFDEQLGHVV